MSKKIFDVVIVGGGAAGLMAAVSAARCGASVCVLDHFQVPAKKILATGNGRCNFTNEMQGAGCYQCDDPDFVFRVIRQFDQTQVCDFFRHAGVFSKSRQGYCYPRSGQALAIRNALLSECDREQVLIRTEIGIQKIIKEEALFHMKTKSGDFYGRTCILATGGKAAPGTGSDGSGYLYAKRLGHTLSEPLPALVPLIGEGSWFSITSGVRADASVTLLEDQKAVASDTGEVQMTDYGISGIPVFQVSRFASRALAEGKKVTAELDFLPEISDKELSGILQQMVEHCAGRLSWQELLSGLVNRKVAALVCKLSHIPADCPAAQVKGSLPRQIQVLVRQIKKVRVPVCGTKTFEQAQVTTGGIAVSEITAETMESKLVSGLYFAGEIVDVDGICGGYNLQWAWSSGYVAGHFAAQKKNGKIRFPDGR